MANENELYKEVKETEREVAKNPPQEHLVELDKEETKDVRKTEKEAINAPVEEEKLVLTKEELKEVKETEREVGARTPDVQQQQPVNDADNTGVTAAEADEIINSPVDHLLSRKIENNTSGATNNDTGIFPGPEANH